MEVASSAISTGVKPIRPATIGSIWKFVAGPLIVLSIPFWTSTTPPILADGIADSRSEICQQHRIVREDLDLDRLRSIRQIADHVLKNLSELDVEFRLSLLDLGACIGYHLIDIAVALGLQLHRDVARVRFGDRCQSHLQAGAPGGAFHLRHVVQNSFHVLEHAIRLRERTACGHDVVEDESSFVHFGQKIGAEASIAQVTGYCENPADTKQHEWAAERPFQAALVPLQNLAHHWPVLIMMGVVIIGRFICRSSFSDLFADGRSRRNSRLSAGVQVTASSSEVSSATVMVIARARKKLPVTPVTETRGRKTTTGVIVDPTRGAAISRSARRAACARGFTTVPMRDDVLDDHDRIIDHQSNCRRQSAEGHQIETFSDGPQKKNGDRDGYWNHQSGDQRRRPVTEEKEEDNASQQEPDENRVPDAADAFAHQFRLIVIRF